MMKYLLVVAWMFRCGRIGAAGWLSSGSVLVWCRPAMESLGLTTAKGLRVGTWLVMLGVTLMRPAA